MFRWFLFAFCALSAAYGVWTIRRDINRGHVSGRGFGFDRATQPRAYFALMTFNCVVVALLSIGAVILGIGLLRRLISN
jgi:hypothetical protein